MQTDKLWQNTKLRHYILPTTSSQKAKRQIKWADNAHLALARSGQTVQKLCKFANQFLRYDLQFWFKSKINWSFLTLPNPNHNQTQRICLPFYRVFVPELPHFTYGHETEPRVQTRWQEMSTESTTPKGPQCPRGQHLRGGGEIFDDTNADSWIWLQQLTVLFICCYRRPCECNNGGRCAEQQLCLTECVRPI